MIGHPAHLGRSTSVLLAIDLQERLLSIVHEPERLAANAALLLRSAAILGVPVLPTTQNLDRLGPTRPDIADALPESTVHFDKLTFSAARMPALSDTLREMCRPQIVLCGVETHVCVAQTAMDLVADGYQVHVVADAVSSRTIERHKLGMERLRDLGILPIGAEATVFEWLAEAGTPEFRQILALVK
ncbi:MAG: isochorismatase family protein [Capsulimonadaceae bacterium]